MKHSSSSIIMYGTPWCGDCHRSRRVLERRGVAYDYVDIEEHRDAALMVRQLNGGYSSVPTILFPDGSILVEPSDKVLEIKLGACGE
jgi:mycoredoxin